MKKDSEVKQHQKKVGEELRKTVNFLEENQDKWYTFEELKEELDISEATIIFDLQGLRIGKIKRVKSKFIDDDLYFSVESKKRKNYFILAVFLIFAVIIVFSACLVVT